MGLKKLSVISAVPGSKDAVVKDIKEQIKFKGGYLTWGELEDGWWFAGMSKKPLTAGNALKKFDQWYSKKEEGEARILFQRARDRGVDIREL